MARPHTRRVYVQEYGQRRVAAFFSGAREITDELAVELANNLAASLRLEVREVPGGYLVSDGEPIERG